MSRHNEQTLKEAIAEMLKTYRLQGRMDELKLMDSWGKVMGAMVQNRTRALEIRNHVLYVKLESASLRDELSYSREQIIDRLNEEAGSKVITNIVLS
jgi:hypothetical protein